MIPFDETKYPSSKRVGVVTEVTLITPIKGGRVEGEYRTYRERLQSVLDDLQRRELQGLPTPVGLIRQIHFARWVIIDRKIGPAELLFTSNFDGEMKSYFRSFALELTSDINTVWENCEGYPGAEDFDRLWQYIKQHQINTATFYCAYPNLTMPQIQRLQALKDGFDEFARSLAPAGQPSDGAAPVPGACGGALQTFLKRAYAGKPFQAPKQTKSKPTPGGGEPPRKLELGDIQSNILGSPPWRQAFYRFLTIVDPQAFKQGLARLQGLGEMVGFITAEPFAQRKGPNGPRLKKSLNIGFTWTGLKQLGLAQECLDGMTLAFQQGMAERAQILGDVDQSAPDAWPGLLGQKDIHVLIAAFCMDGDVKDYWREIETSLGLNPRAAGTAFPGCKVIHEESGARIEEDGKSYEPFGFRDGIGQPAIEGFDELKPGSKKTPIAAGEFILGYKDVDGNDQIAANLVGEPLRDLCDNGSYMVFRKIEQDVETFRRDVAALKHAAGGEDVATRFVGRRHDGTSLAVDEGEARAPSDDLDDFNYAADPDGMKCPFGSHARRTNPRTAESTRHRIIRRGIPYENGDRQGMLFVCFNARIDAQFEFLQSEWCKKGDFLGAFTDMRDPLIGGGGTFLDPGRLVPFSLQSYVAVRGGEYFFVPGLAALGRIASGGFDKPSTAQAAKDASPGGADQSAPPDQTFDPVTYPSDALAGELLKTRKIAEKRVAWASGKQRTFYYVACRDQFLKILAADDVFTSDPYATKLKLMLGGYDHRRWLRHGETDNLDSRLFQSFMLGMVSTNPEKKARLELLRAALGASDVPGIRKQIGDDVGPIAKKVVAEAIGNARQTGVLEIVNPIAYGVPLACAVGHLGFPALTGFSDTYKALYFERTSFEEARDLGFIAQFPQGQARSKLRPELFMLVHTIALCLLIDQYDTQSALDLARFAVRELLNRLADEVLAEEDRIAKGKPSPTLLSRLLKCRAAGVDPATFRARAGMIVAELVVGGIDTPAKGITNVVDCLLSNPNAFGRAKDAVDRGDDPLLDTIVLEALRLKPVADLIVRECPKGATLALTGGSFQFEKESRLFLIPGAAMIDPVGSPLPANVDLRTFLLQPALDPIRRLGFGDGAHGCLGSEIVLAETREVLKQLLPLRNLRRAAGPMGKMHSRFSLPVSLEVRFDP